MGCESSKLDRDLIAEHDKNTHTTCLLFLGAGESGKSTFLKQCKEIYSKTNSEDMQAAQSAIYQMIIHQIAEFSIMLRSEAEKEQWKYTLGEEARASLSAMEYLSSSLSKVFTHPHAEHLT
eukprot:996481_1